jgi:hypothetical protein
MSQNTNVDSQGNYIPGNFDKLVAVIQKSVDTFFEEYPDHKVKPIFFKTVASDEALWNAYLSGFSEENRKHHECNCCKAFIIHQGSYVYLDQATGTFRSLFFGLVDMVPEEYQQAVSNLIHLLEHSRVTDAVFLTNEDKEVGSDIHGGWTHLKFQLPITPVRVSDAWTAETKQRFFGDDETKECAIGMENCDRSYIYMAREEPERNLPSKLQEYNKDHFPESELEAPADCKERNVPGIY